MNGIMEDTICAPASGSGGAICTIRVSGPDTMGVVDSVVSFAHGSASASRVAASSTAPWTEWMTCL